MQLHYLTRLMRKETTMIEFLYHIMAVVITAIVILLIIHLLNHIDRKSQTQYRITYEYMKFRYSYHTIDECIEELKKLGANGWEIATCASEDSFAAYLILKRETLHTSKNNGK